MFRSAQIFLGQTKVALLDDEKFVQCFYIVRQEDINLGDVYVARVVRYLPVQKGCFVSLPWENTGYLPVRDVVREGDYLQVQVVQEARLGKYPKLRLYDKNVPFQFVGLVRKGSLYTDEAAKWPEVPWSDEFDEILEKSLNSCVVFGDSARLVIERTTAFWSIDIDSARSSLPFDEINQLALPIIVREVMLRNIGGNLIVDCIGSKKRSLVKKYVALLESYFKKDYENVRIMGISPMGHIEILRERSHSALIDVLNTPVAVCYRLFEEVLINRDNFLKVFVAPHLFQLLKGAMANSLRQVELKKGASIHITTDCYTNTYRLEKEER